MRAQARLKPTWPTHPQEKQEEASAIKNKHWYHLILNSFRPHVICQKVLRVEHCFDILYPLRTTHFSVPQGPGEGWIPTPLPLRFF